jgi:hypothetical protein
MMLVHGGVVARLWISAAWLVSACIVVPAAQAAEEASAFDGRAALQLDGIVGNPDYAVGRAFRGTPYSYCVRAAFAATSGSGQRIGKRKCDFRFQRR